MSVWSTTSPPATMRCRKYGTILELRTRLDVLAFPHGIEPDPMKNQTVLRVAVASRVQCECGEYMYVDEEKDDHA